MIFGVILADFNRLASVRYSFDVKKVGTAWVLDFSRLHA